MIYIARIAFVVLLALELTARAAVFGNNDVRDRLQLTPNKSRAEGEWRAGLDAFKSKYHSGMNIEIVEGHSTYGFYLPDDRAPIVDGKPKDGGPIRFTIPSEAGEL